MNGSPTVPVAISGLLITGGVGIGVGVGVPPGVGVGVPAAVAVRVVGDVAVWVGVGVGRAAVAGHVLVGGSWSAPPGTGMLPLNPPATSTLPLGSKVAVCVMRAVARLPVAVQV